MVESFMLVLFKLPEQLIFLDFLDSGLELSSPPGPEAEGLRTPPLDWSLKARARFTSRHSFGWIQVVSCLLAL